MVFDKPIYVTSHGLAELKEELAHLQTVKRPRIIGEMQEAKTNGDWKDQTEYILVEEELAFVDGRIQELQHMIDHAQLIEPGNEDNIVNIGETVTLQTSDGETECYTIVGVAEADPAQGFISNESPLGQALLDHKVGEEVIVHAPMGEIRYKIMSVAPRLVSKS
jgi:transcription elongation factor GreA